MDLLGRLRFCSVAAEGLDIPECALVAILDADKEGYLRSKTSLIQTIGRAARNIDGRVILYADTMTKSLTGALEETNRRREKQQEYNAANGITPESIRSNIADILNSMFERDRFTVDTGDAETVHLVGHNLQAHLASLETRMREAAANLEFEEAARLRDEIRRLETQELELLGESDGAVALSGEEGEGLLAARRAERTKASLTNPKRRGSGYRGKRRRRRGA